MWTAEQGGGTVQTLFEAGVVTRLIGNEFSGYFVRIYDPVAEVHSAIHPISLRKAAKLAIEGPLRAAGWDMRVAALDEKNFKECHISRNSGFLWQVGSDSFPVFLLDAIEELT